MKSTNTGSYTFVHNYICIQELVALRLLAINKQEHNKLCSNMFNSTSHY